MLPNGGKYLVLTDPIIDYVDASRTPGDEDLFVELRKTTKEKFADDAIMEIPDHQGTFLTIVAKMVGAKNALEIGTFTGHSSISIARGLADDGKLICMDMSQEWTDVAQTFWERAGLTDRIELQIGDALESIKRLPEGLVLDLVHIDAEKTLYDDFFEAVFPRIRSGGVILFDNMLRGGAVVDENSDPRTESIKLLNAKLAADPRVETVLLTIGDGVQLTRKK